MSAEVVSLELHRISRDYRRFSDEAVDDEMRRTEARIAALHREIEELGQRALSLSMESLRRQGLLTAYEVGPEVSS